MEKYKELSIKQFVDSSSDIRWCPFPDCSYAICMKREEKQAKAEGGGAGVGGAEAVGGAKLTCGENVECGQGHGFCW